MLRTKFGKTKIGPVVFEKKMLTDDGCQPISIGHLSYSGDLIKMAKLILSRTACPS